MNIPDHPQIACALRTGYPTPPRPEPEIRCAECGRKLDLVFEWDGDTLCEDCCRTAIEENFSVTEIAQALNIAVMMADEYEED